MIDPKLISMSLDLCSKVYSPDLFDEIGLYRDSSIGSRYVEHGVYNDTDRCVTYLVFAGSDGIGDWAHNFDARQVRTNVFGTEIEFHRGFFYQAMAYIASMVCTKANYFRYSDMIITGHSQGAAIAGIASMFLGKFLAGTHRINPILVACPRFTDTEGKKLFDRMYPDAIRIINGGDAVTKVPFDLDTIGFDYEHVGKPIHIGPERAIPVFSDHRMSEYINNWKEWTENDRKM